MTSKKATIIDSSAQLRGKISESASICQGNIPFPFDCSMIYHCLSLFNKLWKKNTYGLQLKCKYLPQQLKKHLFIPNTSIFNVTKLGSWFYRERRNSQWSLQTSPNWFEGYTKPKWPHFGSYGSKVYTIVSLSCPYFSLL